MIEYRLLNEFRGLFKGKQYLHRSSVLGDWVAMHLYEDLIGVNQSGDAGKYALSVTNMTSVYNSRNKRIGIDARCGDGAFGELIPGEEVVRDPGYAVARGPIAKLEIGVEVKILNKAMNKQIDRVKSDLRKQVEEFNHRADSRRPISVALVGINFAPFTVSYEGERTYRTDGLKHKHPFQEADQARVHINQLAQVYDELVVLPYRATNDPPYAFQWVNETETRQHYGAALVRIRNEYNRRF